MICVWYGRLDTVPKNFRLMLFAIYRKAGGNVLFEMRSYCSTREGLSWKGYRMNANCKAMKAKRVSYECELQSTVG